jgi:hypothetical protein
MATGPLFTPPQSDELASLVSDGRVIPFVGAGFSSSLGYPTWSDLLKRIAAQIEPEMSWKDLSAYANDDLLQIAEYLFQRSYKAIGPLRHIIEGALPEKDATLSAAHVELVNLGARQIYTTNYDDLIEGTFEALGVPVSRVTLPRDVATARQDITQVIKYHGDLRHDETLVLTESSYYRRLDFESPMDLKFRSDLLGRSVLFMGYSFRDINIRVIWFKLMQMMKDIPQEDRLPSYIVRLDANPVLAELDRSVGLRTIVLDADSAAKTDEDRCMMIAEFLNNLSTRSSEGANIPGQDDSRFISSYTLRQLDAWLATPADRVRFGGPLPVRPALLFKLRIPQSLSEISRETLTKSFARMAESYSATTGVCFDAINQLGLDQNTAFATIYSLTRGLSRGRVDLNRYDWKPIWQFQLSEDQLRALLSTLESEIAYHDDSADNDLAYAVDIVKRIARNELKSPEGHDFSSEAESLLERAAQIYSSVSTYEPQQGSAPNPKSIITQINVRRRTLAAQSANEDGPDRT